MAKTLLKNGLLITPTQSYPADILIDGSIIAKIAPSIDLEADTEVDCSGKYLMPGMIDTHVHFREPGFTHKGDIVSESKAALAGGVTTICDMPNTLPQTTSIAAAHDKSRLYEEKSFCNFGIYLGATKTNLDELKRANEDPTVVAIKIFMAESTGEMTLFEDQYLEPIFRDTTRLIAVHAEDENRRLERLIAFADTNTDPYTHALVRDNETARLGTAHAIALATQFNHRLHILHVSTKEELPLIEAAQKTGLVTAETCPHYLFFNREDIKTHAGYRIMNPSLKGKDDSEALLKALHTGILTQITTDHAPHTREEKEMPFGKLPAGLPGIQFALPLLLQFVHEGLLTLNEVVALYSYNPAKNYRIQNKGSLEEGYDADIIIVDPKRQTTIFDDMVISKCGWTPYSGMKLEGGLIESTYVNGSLSYKDNAFFSHAGKGITVTV